jgi:Asp-tRNA(Asn)/Glu-tRNA(Gln) amidotransferase A subunit family amidase
MLKELASAVTAGRVSAVELAQRALDRIERLDPLLNAVVALRAEQALAEAAALDARRARGELVGPLAGVPFLVKDNMDLAGLPTTQGSLLLADAPPAISDGLTPARLRAAGAIPLGKTNVPEFCIEGFTANRLYGVTRNPWAPDWSPGGSSGGSAAAMAAGMVPFATATDGGGSARIPASFCGLFGLKPTNGVIARDPIPFWIDYSTDGVMGASIADVRLLLAVQAGPWPGDPTALPDAAGIDRASRVAGAPSFAVVSSAASAAVRPRIVYAASRFADWGPLPRESAALFDAALISLERDLHLRVQRLPGPALETGNIDEDWFLTAPVEHAHLLGRATIENEAELFSPAALAVLTWGLQVTIEEYLGARRRRFEYVRELDELLGDDCVIVSPTMPGSGFYADGRMPGNDAPGTDDSSYNTQAQNMTGHPALTVPAGVSPNGVPFGLQITGPRFWDDLVLAVGAAWEEAHPAGRTAPGHEPFADAAGDVV